MLYIICIYIYISSHGYTHLSAAAAAAAAAASAAAAAAAAATTAAGTAAALPRMRARLPRQIWVYRVV